MIRLSDFFVFDAGHLSKKTQFWCRAWFAFLIALVCMMVLVGGATRLTGSGLSITEWNPINGVIPPIGRNQWDLAFKKFQSISQFKILYPTLTLEQFKPLYLWEWSHRLLGRVIGFIVAFGLIAIWCLEKKPRKVSRFICLVLCLGALEGLVGWIMVASGLGPDKVAVTPIKLAFHLTLASVLISLLTWGYVSVGLRNRHYREEHAVGSVFRLSFILSCCLIVQNFLGAIYAGHRIVFAQSTLESTPLGKAYLTYHENQHELIVGFTYIHRLFPFIIFLCTCVLLKRSFAFRQTSLIQHLSAIMITFIVVQAVLGMYTITTDHYLMMGLMHQCFSIILLMCSVIISRLAW